MARTIDYSTLLHLSDIGDNDHLLLFYGPDKKPATISAKAFFSDIGLTPDQEAAIDNSIDPSGSNVFVTVSHFNNLFAAKTTDNLAEGLTNLYFTNARARTAVGITSLNTLPVSNGTSYINSQITDNGTLVQLTSGGASKVGVGIVPTELFHVEGGSIRYVDGNQATDKVLRSDASGVASWVSISSLPGLVDGTGTNNRAVMWTDGAASVIGDATWEYPAATNTLRPVTDGSDIGDATHRVANLFMSSTIDIAAASSLSVVHNGVATPRLFLNSSGNFAINSATASAKFHVVGSSGVDPLRVDTDTLTNVLIAQSDGDVGIGGTPGTTSKFQVTNTTRLSTITSTHNFNSASLKRAFNMSLTVNGAGESRAGNFLISGGTTETNVDQIAVHGELTSDITGNRIAGRFWSPPVSNSTVYGVEATIDSNVSGTPLGQTNVTAYGIISSIGFDVSTGNTGYAGYFSSTGGASNYAIVTQAGQIGLNTTVPAANTQVHIVGASSFSPLRVDTSAVNNVLLVNSAGRVGVRNSSPGAPLDVVSDGVGPSDPRIVRFADVSNVTAFEFFENSALFSKRLRFTGVTDFTIETLDVNNLVLSASSASGGAGVGVVTKYFNGGWLEASRVNNVASGFSNLLLMVDGGNLGFGTNSFGTSAAKTLSIGLGTAPSTSPADVAQLYVEDWNGIGTATLRVRNEEGHVFTMKRSAAYTPTNVTTDRSFDANITTIDELADVLGTLIADLQGNGFLG